MLLKFQKSHHRASSSRIQLIFLLALLWVSAHLPFLLGFSLAGASLSKLVVAHDCADADVESLTEAYVAKSLDSIDIGLRWFYCGGLGIALISMGECSTTGYVNCY